MFLLFSDGRNFDYVSFLTFGVSAIPSVAFTLLNSHVSQKVQMLFFFSGYLHCLLLSYIVRSRIKLNILLIIFIYTHRHTHTLVLLPQHFVTPLDIESVSCCVVFCIRD